MQLPRLGPLTILVLRLSMVLGTVVALLAPLALVTGARLRTGQFVPTRLRHRLLSGTGGALLAGVGLPLSWLCVRTSWPTVPGVATLVVGILVLGHAGYSVAFDVPAEE